MNATHSLLTIVLVLSVALATPRFGIPFLIVSTTRALFAMLVSMLAFLGALQLLKHMLIINGSVSVVTASYMIVVATTYVAVSMMASGARGVRFAAVAD